MDSYNNIILHLENDNIHIPCIMTDEQYAYFERMYNNPKIQQFLINLTDGHFNIYEYVVDKNVISSYERIEED